MRKIAMAITALSLFAAPVLSCSASGLSVTDIATGILIKNTGNEKGEGVMIMVKYDENGKLTGTQTHALELDPGEEVAADYNWNGTHREYVWNSESGGIIYASAAGSANVSMDNAPDEEEEIMLIDYYCATVATVGGDGYDEYVLYSYSDSEAKLSVYSKHYGDEKETQTDYIVPYEAVDKCYEVIEKSRFREWEYMDNTYGITGAVVVVKFREDDNSYIRVSSEDMPDGGREALDSVGGVLSGYIRDEYKK